MDQRSPIPVDHSGLALRDAQPMEFTDAQRQLIRDAYASGASDDEFAVLMEIARARRLNPLLRQIHFVSRWDNEKHRGVWSAQVSIDGLRAIAERTGLYVGQDEPEFVENPDGTIKLCRVRVWRRDWPRPAVGLAYWAEYCQMARDRTTGKQRPTAMWSRMPHVMIAKCLPGSARIVTDRGTLPMAEIVRNRLPVRVRSIDLTSGRESWQPVVNWFLNGSTREWVKLWAPNGMHGNRSIRVTPDHPIWTPRGWVKAGELNVGDEVAVASPTLTPSQDQVLLGSLLGDATLGGRKSGSNCPHLAETHADHQGDYLRWKAEALANLRPTVRQDTTRVKGTDYRIIRMLTRSAPVLLSYRTMFYPNGIKRVSEAILSRLDDLGVAVWIMDDGNLKSDRRWPSRPRLRLYTCCFDGIAHERMQVFFKARYGVTPSISRPARNPYLSFAADDTEALLRQLSSYLTFDADANDKRWVADGVEPGPADGTVFVPLLRVEAHVGDELEGRYDIEVSDTHTFLYNNIVLSNCAESLALRKAFPEDMSGLYTGEEMGNAPGQAPAPPAPVQQPTVVARVETRVEERVTVPTALGPLRVVPTLPSDPWLDYLG